MAGIGETITQSFEQHSQRLLVALVIVIAIAAVGLGAQSIRRTITAPYLLSAEDAAAPFSFTNEGHNAAAASIDTDGDGLLDGDETVLYGTSPFLADSDSDGVSDGDEVARGEDPNCPIGQQCAGGSVGVNSVAASPSSGAGGTPTAPVDLRTVLIDAGVPTHLIENISDDDLAVLYQDAVGQVENNANGTPPAIALPDNPTPEEIRNLLRQGGVSDADIAKASDAELVELYAEIKAQN